MDPDYGAVEITLCGETITLEPTLTAMKRIDRHFGSLRAAISQCQQLSLDGLVFVISAGAALDDAGKKRIPELVFKAGILSVVPPVNEFLMLLMNPTGETAEEADSGKA